MLIEVRLLSKPLLLILENYIALKEELEMLKEEIVIKEEDLSKYQRHCISIADEVSHD